MDRIAGRFGVTVDDPETLRGSASGSQVVAVTCADGSPAVLKITVAADGWGRRCAERELDFYRRVAPGLPISTPALLDSECTAETVGILLSAHPPARPAPQWRERHWLALADDLAELHETAPPNEWPEPPTVPDDALREQEDRARTYWLSGDQQAAPPELIDAIRPLLDDPEPLRQPPLQFDRCLVHGDCHTDNILIDDDRLVWADWQNTGLGNPVSDLAFVSSRATPSGADVPLTAMINRYARRRGFDADELARAVLATELGTCIFAWPEYLKFNSPVGVGRINRRIVELGRAWRS